MRRSNESAWDKWTECHGKKKWYLLDLVQSISIRLVENIWLNVNQLNVAWIESICVSQWKCPFDFSMNTFGAAQQIKQQDILIIALPVTVYIILLTYERWALLSLFEAFCMLECKRLKLKQKLKHFMVSRGANLERKFCLKIKRSKMWTRCGSNGDAVIFKENSDTRRITHTVISYFNSMIACPRPFSFSRWWMWCYNIYANSLVLLRMNVKRWELNHMPFDIIFRAINR